MSKIHEAGAKRHPGIWFEANRRAVEILWGSPLSPSDPKVKDLVPRIILSILDAVRLQTQDYKDGLWVDRV